MRISDWSSDVCSSDLLDRRLDRIGPGRAGEHRAIVESARLQDQRLVGFEERRLGIGVEVEPVGDAIVADIVDQRLLKRSEESRVGKECVSTCRARWSPYN